MPTLAPAGRLLLVAPNVAHIERELGVDPHDFRLWVCLHEETHRVQFTAVPWLRDHLRGQIRGFLEQTDLDPSAMFSQFRQGFEQLGRIARGGGDEVSFIDLVQTPAQREIIDRVTAVMSLLEGHADVVMDGVGPEVIPSVSTIRERFQQRRGSGNWLDQFLKRVLGLDAKLRQYRDGAAFVRAVVAEVGQDGFNAVWASPDHLPTKAEITDPARLGTPGARHLTYQHAALCRTKLGRTKQCRTKQCRTSSAVRSSAVRRVAVRRLGRTKVRVPYESLAERGLCRSQRTAPNRRRGRRADRAEEQTGRDQTMGPHPAVAAVRSAVRNSLADLDPGAVVLVACSGGTDSVALAAAAAFETTKAGWTAAGVTVDHGLQPGSADRATKVAAMLAELGLEPVELARVCVGGSGGPEAAARRARYAGIDEVAGRLGAATVLLGHTRDDQAETVLLGLARGSGARSLAGMQGEVGTGGVRYRRPFLGLDRSVTSAACAAEGHEVWDDPHNADPATPGRGCATASCRSWNASSARASQPPSLAPPTCYATTPTRSTPGPTGPGPNAPLPNRTCRDRPDCGSTGCRPSRPRYAGGCSGAVLCGPAVRAPTSPPVTSPPWSRWSSTGGDRPGSTSPAGSGQPAWRPDLPGPAQSATDHDQARRPDTRQTSGHRVVVMWHAGHPRHLARTRPAENWWTPTRSTTT